MNWWIDQKDETARISDFYHNDPGGVLSEWRRVKLLRGMARHPSAKVRVQACRELLRFGTLGQDECWETLSEADKAHLSDGGSISFSEEQIAASRHKAREAGAMRLWRWYSDRESRRLLTAINDRHLRTEFCRYWADTYPGDLDNGCPADRPPPATIVTARGDVPL